jgi:isopentenyldiphosphate isomerase
MSKVISSTWDGNAMTQEDMMKKDTVLVLDNDDNVIGSASKRSSHEFTGEQARGILHRAFSVFLFDESTGELLLQQRASSKITFPNVRMLVVFRRPIRNPQPATQPWTGPLT